MHRILLVEDGPEFQQIIQAVLGKAHQVVIASTISEASTQVANQEFDLIILDVNLPDGDGFRFCSQLQGDEKTKSMPIIFLTGKSDTSDKVMGLSLGAEDYVTKPFDPMELKARVELRLRKSIGNKAKEELLIRGDLKLNLSAQRASHIYGNNEDPLELTPHEFKLLLHFFRNEERVFSREQIIQAVWGNDVHVLDRTIDTHMSNLRRKIGPTQFTIKAVYGVGYSFLKASGQSKVKELAKKTKLPEAA